MTNRTEFETIFGKIPSEADSYKVVADGFSASGKKLVKSDRVYAYEHAFMQQCSQYANRLLLGRFRLIVTIYDDTENGSTANALRIVLNCLQSVKAVADQNKCTELVARKIVDVRHPRVEFALQEVTEPMEIAAFSDFLNRESVSKTKGGKL